MRDAESRWAGKITSVIKNLFLILSRLAEASKLNTMSQNNNENNEFEQWAGKHGSKKKMPFWGWAIIIVICLAIVKEAIHFANSNKNGWSPEHTKDVYGSLEEGLDNMKTDSTSKKNLINCVITKLKNKYPQGLESVNDDSLKSTTAKFISVCGVETNMNLGWSPTIDSILKIKLLETASIRNLSKEHQIAFCNCYLTKLKELYPNGLTETLRESTKDSITNFCSGDIKTRSN